MRYLFRFLCACALGLMPLVGCETADNGGTGGTAGGGGSAGDCSGVEDRTECTSDGTDGLCFDESCYVFDCSDSEDGSECLGYGNARVCVAGSCETECSLLDEGSACRLGPPGDETGVCSNGECTSRCKDDVDCSDYNDCTAESCLSSGQCEEGGALQDGTPCAGGACEIGQCALESFVLPCTDQGIRNAVAAGGGLYTFDCDVPTTVALEHDIIMEKNVALDGEGQLTVDVGGIEDVIQFAAEEGARVEIRGMKVRRGGVNAINNRGTLRLEDCLVTQALHRGVDSVGVLELIRTTVADNQGEGVISEGPILIINSTVSGNRRGIEFGPLRVEGPVTMKSTTVVRNSEAAIVISLASQVTLSNSLVEGACVIEGELVSNGYNIESPGNTCGFDQTGDLVNITEGQLDLGELADNGGPTMTHALGTGSVAIDHIPAVDCEVTEDQRGEPRPETGGTMCDVGAFEVQP